MVGLAVQFYTRNRDDILNGCVIVRSKSRVFRSLSHRSFRLVTTLLTANLRHNDEPI